MAPRTRAKSNPEPAMEIGTAAPIEVFGERVDFFDVVQGSDEWLELRMGIPTASVFKMIMAESDEKRQRATLLNRLAAEIIGGAPMESWSNADMLRGNAQQPWLLQNYAFTMGVDLHHTGFIRRTIKDRLMSSALVVGCSPDGLVAEEGVVETKSMQPDLIVRLVESGRFPNEHKWQMVGEMWVSGRQWTDLKIGYEGFPLAPRWRLHRNEAEIARLRNEVERFDYELKQLVRTVKEKGGIK